MQEFVTEAIIINKESLRAQDARYAFYTKRYGKIIGKATSARKITSKLAAHLEPGNLSKVRFIERGGTQIADALKIVTLSITLPDLRLLNLMLPQGEPDPALWNELLAPKFSWIAVLRIMGWDPEGAICEMCGRPANYFYVTRQEFFCAEDASKLKQDELILLTHAQL